MRTIILIILSALLLSGCCKCEKEQPELPKKPFVITDIYVYSFKHSLNTYEYIDANGQKEEFTDSMGKYSVGDTIK